MIESSPGDDRTIESSVSLPPVLPEHDDDRSEQPAGHDQDYLRRREAQERAAAEQAPDPAARHVHANWRTAMPSDCAR